MARMMPHLMPGGRYTDYLMARTTIDELKKSRLAAMTADERTAFAETYEATRLALDVGEKVRDAREAARVLALAPTAQKNAALKTMALAIRGSAAKITAANQADVSAAKSRDLKESFIDRLTLTPARIEAMAKGLEEIAELPDPVGATLSEWTRPNGMKISRVRVPIGVIGIIFESRPNVTADAGAHQ